MDSDPNPGTKYGYIRTQKKRKKRDFVIWKAGGLELGSLHKRPKKNTVQFLIRKKSIFYHLNFCIFFIIKNSAWIRPQLTETRRVRIQIQWMWIRNTAKNSQHSFSCKSGLVKKKCYLNSPCKTAMLTRNRSASEVARRARIGLLKNIDKKWIILADLSAVLRIRIRIHMFLGLPDPLVRGMDPDPDPSLIVQE